MATTLATDLQIREDLIYGSFYESLQNKINIFNQDSQGCITMSSEALSPGYVAQESFLKNFGSDFIKDRDPVSLADATALKSTEGQYNKHRFAKKFGPVSALESSFIIKGGGTPNSIDYLRVGERATEFLLNSVKDRAIAMLATTITDVGATAIHTSTSVISYNVILDFLQASRGDDNSRGRLLVMDSITWTKLAKALSTSNVTPSVSQLLSLYQIPSFNVPILVIDNSDLQTIAANARTMDRVLLLNEGACHFSIGELRQIYERKGGKDNIELTWQAELDGYEEVKGFQFSEEAGDRHPSITSLRDRGKWAYQFASVHDGPGYILNASVS